MAIVIAVANQKGGVAKTTTAVHIAHGLALKNFSALLIDLDAQGQCALSLNLAKEDGVFEFLISGRPMRDVVRLSGRDGLWLLPGGKRTRYAELILSMDRRPVSAIGDKVRESVNGSLHYIVIDTPPSTGGMQEAALWTCDLLVIPSAVDYLALEGVAEIIKTLQSLGRPALSATWILPTFHDETTKESRANLERLREKFGDGVREPIHRTTLLRECPALGKTIFEHAPESRASNEYGKLVVEVVNATTGQ